MHGLTAGGRDFGGLNPLSVLAVCLAWLLASTLLRPLAFQLAVLALFLGLLLAGRRAGPLRLLALMLPFALFGFGILTTNVLFGRENAAAVSVFSRDLAARGGVQAGLALFARALAGGAVSLFFALGVDPGGFVKALMRYLRLPPAIAYALFAALQIVPDVAARMNDMRMAAAMREGRAVGRLPRPRELASLAVPLLAFAIRRAGQSAVAMEARGFSAARPRTILGAPGFRRRDALFVSSMLALLVAAAVLLG